MFLAFSITLLSYLSVNYSKIDKQVFRLASKSSARLQTLKKERETLKNEQDSLSMVDNFVKYSKIQRRLNILEGEIMQLGREKMGVNLQIRLVFRIIIGVCLFIISMYYRNTPAIEFKRSWNFFPISGIISYPCESYDCVSVPFWIVCSMSAIAVISQ